MTEEEALKKTSSGNVRKYADNVLPMARIKKIMKMDPNISDGINIEANYVVCAAAELFIKHLAKEVYEMDTRCLTYKNLASYIAKDDKLDFLQDVVPVKITVRDYKKILSEEKVKTIDDSNSEASTSDDSSDEDEDDSEDASGEEEEDDVAK